MKLFTRPAARATDPDTSREAADSVYRPSEVARFIAQLFLQGSMDDETLVADYEFHAAAGYTTEASDQSIRSRRAELTRAGILEFTGSYSITRRGRRCRIWQLTQQFDRDDLDWMLLKLQQTGSVTR
jgi:hypothetical protein